MEKPLKQIKDNYAKYQELLAEIKNSSEQTITLDEIKGNHKNTRTKTVSAEHMTIVGTITLTIESKIENKKDFKFKLRAPQFIGSPFFRFDSDGQAHYNRIPDVELAKQKIDTPHFHRYDSEGRNFAYRTNPLEIENEREALLNDINLCMAHYSDESKLYYNNNVYIEIVQTPPTELDFDSNRENPTEGVDYE